MSPEHLSAARTVNRLQAVYKEAEDLINIGAYEKGSNPEIDRAIAMIEIIRKFLQQDAAVGTSLDETSGLLMKIAEASATANQPRPSAKAAPK